MNISEEELIKNCLAGSGKYQKALYDAYCNMCWGIALRYTSNKDDAQDMLQETFINVFNHLYEYHINTNLGAWIRKICINNCLMNYRKNAKHLLHLEISDVGQIPQSEMQKLHNLDVEDLLNLVQKLPEGYRMVFNLYGVEGYTHEEIGELLNIQTSTSRSQYARARKLLIEYYHKANTPKLNQI